MLLKMCSITYKTSNNTKKNIVSDIFFIINLNLTILNIKILLSTKF